MIVAVALVALPTMAQFTEPERPQATFQSTSTMTPSGSQYSSNPSLNSDGTAYDPASSVPVSAPAQAPNGPRKINPIAAPTPVGDAVLPFTLLSMVAAGAVYLRRRKQQA